MPVTATGSLAVRAKFSVAAEAEVAQSQMSARLRAMWRSKEISIVGPGMIIRYCTVMP